VDLWKDIEKCAILAIKTGKTKISKFRGISFSYDGKVLQIGLPSGRKLIYQSPRIVEEVKWEHLRKDPDTGEQESVWIPLTQKSPGDIGTDKKWTVEKITYMGMDEVKKIWRRIDSYGGKLVENIVQAIARDILAVSMMKLDSRGFDIVMHVHDESVADLERETAEERLEEMCQIMGEPIEWAEGLPLAADGYLTEFYKKDD
jgi:DNA polymerase